MPRMVRSVLIAIAAFTSAPTLEAHVSMLPHTHAVPADGGVAGWFVLMLAVAALLVVLSLGRFVRRRSRGSLDL